jgi:NADH:ubiquinone oxidoreductase subunit 5 (subunit L)/multisubunit Na+/H+ antiporter MnhA subunit
LKTTTAKDKYFNSYVHAIFNALLFVASGKYIKEADEREMMEERYL